jgi:hypothetical protein
VLQDEDVKTIINIDFNKLSEFKDYLLSYDIHNYILDINDGYRLIIYYNYKIFTYSKISIKSNIMLLQLTHVEPVKQFDNIYCL